MCKMRGRNRCLSDDQRAYFSRQQSISSAAGDAAKNTSDFSAKGDDEFRMRQKQLFFKPWQTRSGS